MKTIEKCKNCKTDRIVEESTGMTFRRLEQNIEDMQKPCKDCINWVQELLGD